ncbi:MAG: DNA mismatch repair protein MutS [Thermoflavifilum sp.]|nr:DNA mismatch repair protein MutS [Thermoflavifilum sp.]
MTQSKHTLTPLMQQHKAIKARYPDAILLFRVGDFYETFYEDAVIASRVLGIVLTKRSNGAAAAVDLAGFPYHALDTYLHKLVKAGYRVAVCDQLEDPKQAKGVVKRGVTELITPGIALHEKLLEHNANNFLAALHFGEKQIGLAFVDVSTGEMLVAEGDQEYADKLLQSLRPAEIVFARPLQKQFRQQFGQRYYTYPLEEWIFSYPYAEELLIKHFHTHSLKGFGIDHLKDAIVAAGAILHYLRDTEHPDLQHISSIQRIDRNDFLWMDKFTLRNLELVEPLSEQSRSLLQVLDHTLTPMGARLLKRWLLFPLQDLRAIQERLDAVSTLIKDESIRHQLNALLKQMGDVERLVARIPLHKISPRELWQLGKSLQLMGQIQQLFSPSANPSHPYPDPYLRRQAEQINACPTLVQKIFQTLVDNPPVASNKGGIIREGVSAELDELRKLLHSGKTYLQQLQQKEAERTGIPSLKLGFNSVFGYYLEVTHAHRHKVPADWIRKQTLTHAERYVTPELKQYEEKILGAEENILLLEQQLFEALVHEMEDYIPALQLNAQVIARLDCIRCFAENALQFHYRRPELHEGETLEIHEGRHPVIEQSLKPGEHYVPNDLYLDCSSQQIIILTGPNMSGKSALLRQTALITLMAHIGSFVPAASAKISLTDKIFTRVGASDNLSGGESTFMVEMNETASIIHNFTQRSLVILDEIGRGTSTYDGISIAWSIVEYLHHGTPFHPKTLFATHYHELNELEKQLDRVKNYHITHAESGNKIIFLRKLAPGGSRHSFGIHVARMAGMPPELVQRAEEILQQLEAKYPDKASPVHAIAPKANYQLSIFDEQTLVFQQIRQLLQEVDINRLTPVEALMKLNEIKKRLG